MQIIKNDLKYAEAIRKDAAGYTIAFKQYDPLDAKGYKDKFIRYEIATNGTAPDGSPNFKLIRTQTDISSATSATLEFFKIAGISWCLDGIDANGVNDSAGCPNLGATAGSGKISTSSRRFIVEFRYRVAIVKSTALQKRNLVANLENIPADGGSVNPILVKP
jgi:hypothetical protein